MATIETSRSYRIDLPLHTAEMAEELASRERLTLSELVSVALRAYSSRQIDDLFEKIGEYAASLKSPYTEADVPRLIAEVRAEEAAEHRQR